MSARRVYTVEPPEDLLAAWIDGNRNHVRAVLRMEPSKALATFAAMLDMARDDIRQDLITTFKDGPGRVAPKAPAVRQTACRYCGLDIENTRAAGLFRAGEWRDRGNNTHCPTNAGDAAVAHAPVRAGR